MIDSQMTINFRNTEQDKLGIHCNSIKQISKFLLLSWPSEIPMYIIHNLGENNQLIISEGSPYNFDRSINRTKTINEKH